MSIVLSTLAQESLLEIVDYYETQVSEEFADSIEKRIKEQIFNLSGFEKSIPVSEIFPCLLYTSPSPRDGLLSRMPSSA